MVVFELFDYFQIVFRLFFGEERGVLVSFGLLLVLFGCCCMCWLLEFFVLFFCCAKLLKVVLVCVSRFLFVFKLL